MPFPTFSTFFVAVTGHEPHGWQSQLAQRFQNNDMPSCIEVPTGLGKTATILIGIYHLAWQLHHGHERTAPQRIFHVVNRRTLVDDTHGFIGSIARIINEGEGHPVIGPVRAAVCRLLGPGDDIPIVVGSIHGGTSLDTSRLRATGCSILTLTPHQYVSQLLMRAFAISPSLRPIYAGLAGVDRLVLFDEPHLATPAVQTILDVQRLQAQATEQLGVPVGGMVLLGATLPTLAIDGLNNGSMLKLNMDDPEVAGSPTERLLRAPKRLHLERTKSSSDTDIAKAMAMRATTLAADGRSVVVFANTVGIAQHVYRLLKANRRWATQTQLITSRFRPSDRKQTADVSAITVTTQCLEVGVDLSFGALVTEATSWSALTQRLGRLNRHCESETADAYFVLAATGSVRAGTKAVYGEDTVAAAVELLEHVENEPEGIDVSPAALSRLRRQHDNERLDGETPRAATLHAGLLPLMTHTRPSPSPDLPVEAFVTGPDQRVNREIEVAWREQAEGLNETRIGAVLANEVVSVPRSALARLLRGEMGSEKEPIADLPGTPDGETSWQRSSVVDLGQLRIWSGRKERAQTPESIGQALAAERVVLPRTAGGYNPELGWTGEPGAVDDVHLILAFQALQQKPDEWRRTRLSLCLSASLFREACSHLNLTGDQREDIEDLLVSFAEAGEDSLDSAVNGVTAALGTALQKFLVEVAHKGTAVQVRVDDFVGIDGPQDLRAVVCTVTVTGERRNERGDVISLDAHQEQVGAWAQADGRAAGLRDDLCTKLGVAGRHHDIGKALPSFQRYFAGAPTAEVTSAGITLADGTRLPLLAKPLADVAEGSDSSRAADRIARAAAGVPPGFRHEAKSVEVCRLLRLDDLVIHLGGSHHGFYRPTMPPLREHLEGYSHADDFARLNQRFGPWGLAFLEAVLRLADWRASGKPSPEDLSVAQPSESILSHLRSARWDAPNHGPAGSGEGGEQVLPGLVTHPLTGWLASVGLLAAAVDLGDGVATLRWDDSGVSPQIPILKTSVPLHDIVAHALDRRRWEEADGLVRRVLAVDGVSLRRKNQKLKPADRLRGVMKGAELERTASLILGLVGDAARADSKNQVELPIVPFANNSSYPGVGLLFLQRETAIEECLGSLVDMNLGYSKTACDGGLDRSRSAAPLVNGIGAPGDERAVRVALAPLALYGMARLGNTGASALGVTRKGRDLFLLLPLPTRQVTFEMLRSMTIGIKSPTSWAWSEIGADWIYHASREYLSERKEVDIVWSGRIMRRS